MKTIEYTTYDKSDWVNGPWKDEIDKRQWQDEATGLPCLIVRGPIGALCGYVGVPSEHPWHGLDYDNVPGDIDVHGGLTFARGCSKYAPENKGVCHLPEPGEPDDIWWFGFDCAHLYDLTSIKTPAMFEEPEDVYRDVAYVQAEVSRLAKQIAGDPPA